MRKEEENLLVEYVKLNGHNLANISVHCQTEKICLAAVRENGMALQYVVNQTEAICLAAVKKYGHALKYVREQTEKICMEAIKQNNIALHYVKDQTEKICLEAVKQNGMALRFVKEQTEEICLAAVRKNGLALQYVKNQTPNICLAAIANDIRAINLIKRCYKCNIDGILPYPCSINPNNLRMGYFITFEGGEGSGKSTVCKLLRDLLKCLGFEVVLTREPGGCNISEKIREVLLSDDSKDINPYTEALLFAAARNQHAADTILPAIRKHKIVISDRYKDTSIVYQGYANNLGIDYVRYINNTAIDPDLTIYLDVKPEIGLARIKNNNRETNRIDQKEFEFHDKVRNGFIMLSMAENNRIVTINTDEIKEIDVALKALNAILEYINTRESEQ